MPVPLWSPQTAALSLPSLVLLHIWLAPLLHPLYSHVSSSFSIPSPQATICPGHRSPKVPQPTGVHGKSQASLQNAACLSTVSSPVVCTEHGSSPDEYHPGSWFLHGPEESSTGCHSSWKLALTYLSCAGTACPQHRPAQCPDSLNTDSLRAKECFSFLLRFFFQFLFWSIF